MSAQQGLAGSGRDVVGPMVLGAWDDFVSLAEKADLTADSRLPGWRGHEVCVHLGLWDDHKALAGLIDSARNGGAGDMPDADVVNERVTRSHRDASRGEVLDALRRHRDAVRDYLENAEPSLDTASTASTVGRLPLLSVVLGQAYELAVHGLDLEPCGAPPPSADTLQAGLAALAEVTGALAAQSNVKGGATLLTPEGGWRFDAGADGWTVERTGAGRPKGAVVEGSAETLLDASAGRANPVMLLGKRKLKTHDLGKLLALAPIVEHAPNVPGGPILRLAAKSLSGPARWLFGR